MIKGVVIKIGIENAINNVCIWVNAIVRAIPLAVPTKIDRKEPAQVGHAINNPVIAPIELAPLPFFVIEYAPTAIDVFNPTRYDTMI